MCTAQETLMNNKDNVLFSTKLCGTKVSEDEEPSGPNS